VKKKASYISLRKFGEFCIDAGVFFGLVALYGIYLLIVGLNAVYCAILRHRQTYPQTKDNRGLFA
jgi:hypothetical protein